MEKKQLIEFGVSFFPIVQSDCEVKKEEYHGSDIDLQQPTADINQIIIYGQSLSNGMQGCPSLSRTNYKGNLMIGNREWSNENWGSGFSPLIGSTENPAGNEYIPSGIGDGTKGESPAVNTANSLKHLFDRHINEVVDRKFLVTTAGTGGKTIEQLSKNTDRQDVDLYSNGILTSITKSLSAATSAEKSIKVPLVIWMQGENNEADINGAGWNENEYGTRVKDTYKKYLIGGHITKVKSSNGEMIDVDRPVNGLLNDIFDDIRINYDQTERPLVLTYSIGLSGTRSKDMPINMALLEASNTVEYLTFATPTYRVTNRGVHLDPNGYRWMGEFFAKVYYKKVICGENWKPLQPNRIKIEDNNITLTFDVMYLPLEFDTNQVQLVDNYGFDVYVDDTRVTINELSIENNNVIINTSTDDLTTHKVAVSYADRTFYGNLRDSDPWIAFENYIDLDSVIENPPGVSYRPTFEPVDENGNVIYGKKYPCQNFCVPFYYELEEGIDDLYIDTSKA